jgi:hypothetical protein
MEQENQNTKPDYTTVEGLKQHPLFGRLDLKHQQFLLAYIELKEDRLAAVRAVTQCRTPNSISNAASRFLANDDMRQLLRIYYQCEIEPLPANKRRFVGALTAKLSDPNISTSDFISIARMAASIAGWEANKFNRIVAKAPIEKEKSHTVDQLVQKMEEERKRGNISDE